MGTYRIIEISDSIPELPEQLGTKKKFWFHLDNTLYLFKIGRPGTGENWSEKAAAELCNLLGLPCASYELATWEQEDCRLIFNAFPDGYISSFGKDFALSLLRHNRERLLNSASAEQ